MTKFRLSVILGLKDISINSGWCKLSFNALTSKAISRCNSDSIAGAYQRSDWKCWRQDAHSRIIRAALMPLLVMMSWSQTGHAQQETYECLMEPAVQLELSSSVEGIIKSIEVDRGSKVEKGQKLVKLDATAELATIRLAKAKLEFGQRKVSRTEELFREKFTSEYSVDEAVTETRLAEVELAQARTLYGLKTLTSPISGIVVERLAEVGEFVSDDEILRLAQLDPLHIEVILPLEQLNSISEGMEATVYPGEPVGGEYKAIVETVDQVLDAASGTFGVRLILPNPDSLLPAGLRCRIKFPQK